MMIARVARWLLVAAIGALITVALPLNFADAATTHAYDDVAPVQPEADATT